jgi:hypothetical protein
MRTLGLRMTDHLEQISALGEDVRPDFSEAQG